MFLRSFNQIKTGKLTLSSTAQKLALQSTLENSRMDGGRSAVEIVNTSENTAYIGDSTVTTSTGLPIAAGASHIFPVQFGSADKIYAVGSGDVIIAEYF